jgi:hypothetical protein
MSRRRATGAGAARLEQIPERLLAVLWKERAARQQSFRSMDGRTFRVIYPGRASTTAGPDFRDAVLVEEGLGVVRGDVEIHVTHGDWESHGHTKDPRYNGVVLHAVGGPSGSSTVLRSGQRAPVVSLDALLEARGGPGAGSGLWALMEAWGYGMPGTAPELGALLDRAGDDRFLSGSRRYGERLTAEGPDQLLYSGLMEALGYSQNRDAFLDLAGRVPYSTLDGMCSGLRGPERAAAIEARLLSAAGLDGVPRPGAPPIAWHLFRVRPQNHPRRRIAGWARVLEPFLAAPPPAGGAAAGGWRGRGLAEGAARLLRDGREEKGRGRWSALERVLMGSRPAAPAVSRAGPKAVGRARARDMIVNCVMPFLHAWAKEGGDRELEDLSLEGYRRFPRLQENEITREMARLASEGLASEGLASEGLASEGLPGGGDLRQVVDGARRQQGLVHLHRVMSGLGGAAV